jgi:hypothetical protein
VTQHKMSPLRHMTPRGETARSTKPLPRVRSAHRIPLPGIPKISTQTRKPESSCWYREMNAGASPGSAQSPLQKPFSKNGEKEKTLRRLTLVSKDEGGEYAQEDADEDTDDEDGPGVDGKGGRRRRARHDVHLHHGVHRARQLTRPASYTSSS